jgi:hypothetical protein
VTYTGPPIFGPDTLETHRFKEELRKHLREAMRESIARMELPPHLKSERVASRP